MWVIGRHGTPGEAPGVRFERDEARALHPPAGTPPFHAARELVRRVGSDCAAWLDKGRAGVKVIRDCWIEPIRGTADEHRGEIIVLTEAGRAILAAAVAA